MGKLNIDHIVYIVPNLNEAIDFIEDALGIRPHIGGRHLDRGTQNALLDIGNKAYLEILAADTENISFKGERWMGIDLMDQPCISRWCLSTNNLDQHSKHLKLWNPLMGEISQGRRLSPEGKALQWQMILPLAKPKIDIVPFFIDWSSSEKHPCDDLTKGCVLESISFESPQAIDLNKHFGPYFKQGINQGATDKIQVIIRGPKGTIHLS